MGPFWELELDVSGFESSEPSAEFGRMLTEKLAVEEGRIVTAALADLETAYISEVSRSYK
jgi:hypothetical protein